MTEQATPDLGFIHRFVPGEPGQTPLLLLHGTGGDETDLLQLGQRLKPGAALLSPRGQVLENGMPRFFRRRAEGVFDLDDLRARTAELADFIADARAAYDLAAPLALGFSNGANIAASLLLTRPQTLAGAVLIRAMVPFIPADLPALGGKPILMLSGAADPLVSADNREQLAKLLQSAGADLTYKVVPADHALSMQDLALASAWLAGR
jgi:phospholipase/carboxylesterase